LILFYFCFPVFHSLFIFSFFDSHVPQVGFPADVFPSFSTCGSRKSEKWGGKKSTLEFGLDPIILSPDKFLRLGLDKSIKFKVDKPLNFEINS